MKKSVLLLKTTSVLVAAGVDLAALPWLGCLLAAGAAALWLLGRSIGKKQG